MQIQLVSGALPQIAAETLVIFAFEGQPQIAQDAAQTLGLGVSDWIEQLYASGEFRGKPCETATLYRPEGLKAKRVVVAGAGAREKWNSFELRRAAGTATRDLKQKSLRNLHFYLDGGWISSGMVQTAVEGVVLANYEPDSLKTDNAAKERRQMTSLTIVVSESSVTAQRELEAGRIVAEAQNFSRELKNQPANLMTPLVLAEQARQMANSFGLSCEILDEDAMRQLQMGSLLGVSQGSDNPPALIILRYVPSTPASGDHLALVGKGVTFDTGGVSIKPADGMEKMKYDMGGGAAVIGAMQAIAQLKPSVRVTAFIPAVENMVSGRAQRPGDIVTSMSGKTVEVLNTDAEGRLILIDAITYAIRQGCTHLIDAATLTGAIVVALGHLRIGAFTNNDSFFAKVRAASELSGERMWQMPLDDDYKDYLKSAFADIPNIGGRYGGAITAAKFIEEFVEGKPWVHLDIAGTAWLDECKPWMAKGPTGTAVRTFVNLASGWSSAS